MYVVTTLVTAALGTPNTNKVAVLVTDAPPQHAQSSALFANLTNLPFAVLSYKLSLNTICNALAVALHSINKQKNDERYSQLTFFQCS